MKAILEFNLPDDQIDFENAIKGTQYKLSLYEINQMFRGLLKYGKYDNIVIGNDHESVLIEKIREYVLSLDGTIE